MNQIERVMSPNIYMVDRSGIIWNRGQTSSLTEDGDDGGKETTEEDVDEDVSSGNIVVWQFYNCQIDRCCSSKEFWSRMSRHFLASCTALVPVYRF